MSISSGTLAPKRGFISSCSLGLALGAILCVLPAGVAMSDEDSDYMEQDLKNQFQSEYRDLLRNQAVLRANAESARVNYSKAKKRNYPRGAARQRFLVDEENALKELAEIEIAIEELRARGRLEGALPGWFYEVEEGPIDMSRPAAPAEEDPRDMEGRNPLYLDSE